MLYTQAFQRLYRVADSMYGGELPIHVTFLMDEFANVALPDDFCSLISTMRSRSISSIIILQNLAQIKAMFKDTWETITGNCDTTIYLGGNEQSTHEYMSKLLGKATIEKRSTGESRGRQGSSSRNYDVLGRDLMTPDEVSRLDRNKCLIKVAGQPPVIDEKYNTPKHPRFAESADGNGEPFVLKKKKNRYIGQPFEFLGEKSIGYYEKLQQAGDSVEITTVTYDELMILDDLGFMETVKEQGLRQEVDRIRDEEDTEGELKFTPAEVDEDDVPAGLSGLIMERKEKQYEFPEKKKNAFIKSTSGAAGGGGGSISQPEKSETLQERLDNYPFSELQRQEIFKAVKAKLPEEYILSYAYPENSVFKMAGFRVKYDPKQERTA